MASTVYETEICAGSILRSVILCGTFRRISQLWDNAHSLNLENCLLYLSSAISQFFDFVRCIVFDFIFYCVTVHTPFCHHFSYSHELFVTGYLW